MDIEKLVHILNKRETIKENRILACKYRKEHLPVICPVCGETFKVVHSKIVRLAIHANIKTENSIT